MIIGLAFIGFIYGLLFGGRYADVMGGSSTDLAFGRFQFLLERLGGGFWEILRDGLWSMF